MADFRINVIVDPSRVATGSRAVRRELQQVDRQANRTRSLLNRAFLLAGVAVGIRTLAGFEQAMASVKAISGATDQQFQDLTKTARQLGATTRFTATNAAEGLLFLSRAGFSVTESLEAIGGTLTLAQSGALDLGRAADIASNVIQGFRLETSQTNDIVDVLSYTANRANTNVEQLGDAMSYVAPVAAGLGVGIRETAAAVAALSNAGIQGQRAGTGLRRVLAELESPGSTFRDILQNLGISTEEVRVSQVGLTQALITLRKAGIGAGDALEIFGQRGGPAFEVLASSIPTIQEMSKSLEDVSGFSAEVARIMDDNLNGALLRAKSALEAVVLAFGEAGASAFLTDVFNAIANALRALATNIELVTDVLGIGLAAWVAYYAVIKLAPILAAAKGFIELFSAVASGRAVLLGSAAAEHARTVAMAESAVAQKAQLAAQIAAIRAEIQGVETLAAATAATQTNTGVILVNARGQATLAAGIETANAAYVQREALLVQVTALEAKHAAVSQAAAAAQTRVAATSRASRGALGLLLTPLRGITAFLAANPFTAIVVGLTAVGVALFSFRNQIAFTSDGLVNLRTLSIAVFEEIQNVAGIALSYVSDKFTDVVATLRNLFGPAIAQIITSIASVLPTLDDVLLGVRSFVNHFIGFFVGMAKALFVIFKGIGNLILDTFAGIGDAISQWFRKVFIDNIPDVVKKVVDFSSDSIAWLSDKVDGLLRSIGVGAAKVKSIIDETDFKIPDFNFPEITLPPGIAKIGVDAKDAFLEGFNTDYVGAMTDLLSVPFNRIIDRARELGRQAQDIATIDEIVVKPAQRASAAPAAPIDREFLAVLQRLRDEQALLQLSNRERERRVQILQIEDDLERKLTATQTAQVDAILQQNQVFADQAFLLDDIIGAQERLKYGSEALNALFADGKISIDQYTDALRQLQLAALQADRSLQGGLQRALLRIEDQATNTAAQVEDLLVTSFNRTADALAELSSKGSTSFRDLINSIISDLQRLLTQKLLFQLLESFGGGYGAAASAASSAIGSSGKSFQNIPKYASGADFLVGGHGGTDSQLVTFAATPKERVTVTPQGKSMPGDGSGQPSNVNVTSVNLIDTADIVAAMDGAEGDKVFLNFVSRKRRSIAQQVNSVSSK